MRKYQPNANDSLARTIAAMIAIANTEGEPAIALIDGIPLAINPNESRSIEQLVDHYERRARHQANLLDASRMPFDRFECTDATAFQAYVRKAESYQLEKDRLIHRVAALYAARWAKLMEAKLQAGCDFGNAAVTAYQETDERRVNDGFVYLNAVKLLSVSWKHGTMLRCWHNLADPDPVWQQEGMYANKSGGLVTNIPPGILAR